MKEAQVSLPSDSEVKVIRQFNAPRDLVYKAYTTPALMQRWLVGYPGWTMPVCEMDVRVGGKFRWRWRSIEDGKEFGFHGEFREVAAPGKLVHTEIYDPGDIGGNMGDVAIITVQFAEAGGVTTVVTVIDGMEASYQKLDQLLEKLPA